jgi:hypothetical protein
VEVPERKGDISIEARLAQLLSQDLTFKGENTRYASHNLHAFAAKFPPQVPRMFIRELTRRGEWVLDPMVGSGTALVEAVLAGRHAVGVDLDPLAALISHFKSTPLDLPLCRETGVRVWEEAKRNWQSCRDGELQRLYPPQAIEFFHYWFEKRTVGELSSLVQALQRVKEDEVRAFLEVVFSSIIITKSGGITRARDLAHSRPHRDTRKQVKKSAFEAFNERLHAAIESLESIVDVEGRALVIRGDSRQLPLRDGSVHLIVTSPPYAANAIDYVRAHKFSLIWLGYSPTMLTDLRRRYIGAEVRAQDLVVPSETGTRVLRTLRQKDPRRAAVVAHYFRDMESSLGEMLRVLAKGRPAIVVVGSSRIRGIQIEAPAVLAEIAESVGFRLVRLARREILRDARMMPVSHNSTESGIEARMHEEGVIGLLKP